MIWVQEYRGVRDNQVSDNDVLLYCVVITTSYRHNLISVKWLGLKPIFAVLKFDRLFLYVSLGGYDFLSNLD